MLDAMDAARERTLALVSELSDEQLTRVHSPIMSPLVWDLGHIAAYEDLWIANRQGGLPLLRPDLAALYDAFETPRAVRGEIEALGPRESRSYMAAVSARSAEVICADATDAGALCEMVVRHELQHGETMRQTMAIAGLLPARERALMDAALDAPRQGHDDGWLKLPAGSFAMGADAHGFAYDNERPRHRVELASFAIARRPVTNASWLRFSEGGGYERREWWSREGWAWKEEHDITHHAAIAAGRPEAPVCHVSWFEADAFARAHDARLPTEAEWERAATWSQKSGRQPVVAVANAEARRASLEQARAELVGVGRVWEWTASPFHGYPGFVAYPYREYSEVFFGEDYRVLRGGSWASDPRVATFTFRNWDLPQRRQIFAGLRLARDV